MLLHKGVQTDGSVLMVVFRYSSIEGGELHKLVLSKWTGEYQVLIT